MPRHKQDMLLPYRPDQMYELVSDIERYPEFVKWITALRVVDPHDQDGTHHCTGEALVAFKGFTQTFATNVAANPLARTVDVRLARGPLKRLENSWRFEAENETQTRVFFAVDYEFSNFVLRALARANHELAIDRIMGTFLAEAKRRYGKSPAA